MPSDDEHEFKATWSYIWTSEYYLGPTAEGQAVTRGLTSSFECDAAVCDTGAHLPPATAHIAHIDVRLCGPESVCAFLTALLARSHERFTPCDPHRAFLGMNQDDMKNKSETKEMYTLKQ
ncbi:hypothetical protein CRENBAI_009073 [Crenichthys baileyi]|uniref:Uncharacterized protein n=1 Tax=Crenichthys baileyi TaxID=28760 RepID=A0AAV9S7H8_9TELE